MEQPESTLGFAVNEDGITFIAKGSASEGQKRGYMLGRMAMYEELYHELFLNHLMSKDIRNLFKIHDPLQPNEDN